MKINNIFTTILILILLLINFNGCVENNNKEKIDINLLSYHIFNTPGINEIKWLEKDGIVPIFMLDSGNKLIFVNISISTKKNIIPLLEDWFALLANDGKIYYSRDIERNLPETLSKNSQMNLWILYDIPKNLQQEKILYQYLNDDGIEIYGEAEFK